MKHFCLFIALAFIAIYAKANDVVGTTYFTDGMEWRTEIYGTQDPSPSITMETVTIEKHTGDDIFKMYRYYNNDTSSRVFIAFVKTAGDKVFFSSDDSETAEWYLLYDFGIMEGEGCYVYCPLTMSASQIPYKTYIKCSGINEIPDCNGWELMALEEYRDESCTKCIGNGAWIKGLSSLNGVLYNNRFNLDGGGSKLIEVLDNGSVLFSTADIHDVLLKQDGEIHDVDYVFTNDSDIELIFNEGYTVDNISIELLTTSGSFEPRYSVEDSNVICVSQISYKDGRRRYLSELNREAFTLLVTAYKGDDIATQFILNMALLPEKPRLSDIKFTYTFDWEYNDMYPNSDFSFIVNSENADTYFLCVSKDFLFDFDPNEYWAWIKSFDADDPTYISYEAEWGNMVSVIAGNRYGWTCCNDTLFTTSYIDDQAILDRINSLKENASIPSPTADVKVEFRTNEIRFDSPVSEIHIYDLLGNCIFTDTSVDTVDISPLTKGLYILFIRTKEEELRSYKFTK